MVSTKKSVDINSISNFNERVRLLREKYGHLPRAASKPSFLMLFFGVCALGLAIFPCLFGLVRLLFIDGINSTNDLIGVVMILICLVGLAYMAFSLLKTFFKDGQTYLYLKKQNKIGQGKFVAFWAYYSGAIRWTSYWLVFSFRGMQFKQKLSFLEKLEFDKGKGEKRGVYKGKLNVLYDPEDETRCRVEF